MSDDQQTEDPEGGEGAGGGGDAGGTGVGSGEAGGSRFMLWALVALAVFVGGGAFYHLSSQNADRWFLEVRDGEVVVRKGIWFPTGAADYEAGGEAYAPVPLPEGMDPPPRVHDGAQSVDNALYRLLIAAASGAIGSGDPARIESAKGLLSRVRLLAGISQEQADEVLRYRGDIAMAEGHLALREVRALLTRAKQRVEAGASRGTRLYKDPQGWVRWIDAKLAEFSGLQDAREPPLSLCPDPKLAARPATSPSVAAPAPAASPGPAAAPSPLSELTDPDPAPALPFPLFPAADPAAPAADDQADAADAADAGGEGEGELRL